MARDDPADCPFCSIVRGEDPDVQLVASEADWLAFFPLKPATRGHTLLIPRAHVSDYWHADLHVTSALARASVELGRVITDAVRPEGMNLITSAGAAAEQTVFHLHIHLVPRWQTDAMDPIWPRKAVGPVRGDDSLVQSIQRSWRAFSGRKAGW